MTFKLLWFFFLNEHNEMALGRLECFGLVGSEKDLALFRFVLCSIDECSEIYQKYGQASLKVKLYPNRVSKVLPKGYHNEPKWGTEQSRLGKPFNQNLPSFDKASSGCQYGAMYDSMYDLMYYSENDFFMKYWDE